MLDGLLLQFLALDVGPGEPVVLYGGDGKGIAGQVDVVLQGQVHAAQDQGADLDWLDGCF